MRVSVFFCAFPRVSSLERRFEMRRLLRGLAPIRRISRGLALLKASYKINEGLENIWELEEVDRLETLNVVILPEELERTTKQCLVNCTLCLS